MKNTSRQGRRADGTALISFNAPKEMKQELMKIADHEYYDQPKRGRISLLMRKIASRELRCGKDTS